MTSRSGILLIDKPQGITSHDVVARTRKRADTRKVGHAGTLDPMATGLLVVGINSATRLLTFMVGLDKEYFATIRLGAATNTDDAEGEVISGSPTDAVTAEQIDAALVPLRGEISQVPSSVSAIKVGGKRAYTLAREGETVVLKSRAVTIRAFEIIERRHVDGFIDLDVRVHCSSGTYIRALARDLGRTLGVGGHLTALRRTKIGPFDIADASALETLDVLPALLSPTRAATELFAEYPLTAAQAVDISQGKRLQDESSVGVAGPLAATAPDGRLVGLVEISGGIVKVVVNFPPDPVDAVEPVSPGTAT